ncbi:MAG: cation transporter [Acidobacteriota bacterium]
MKVEIEGMHCEACVRRVKMALEKVPGAKVESVAVGSAGVAVDSAHEADVLAAIRKAGYEPKPANT